MNKPYSYFFVQIWGVLSWVIERQGTFLNFTEIKIFETK